jgi:hypothetical protein
MFPSSQYRTSNVTLRGHSFARWTALGLLVVTTQAFAQSPRKLSFSAAAGLHANTGTERYSWDFPLGLRVGAMAGLGHRVGLEIGLQKTLNFIYGGDDTVLAPGGAQKVPYRHFGGTAGLVFAPGSNLFESRVRFVGGMGLYRVSTNSEDVSPVTTSGIHLGIEASIFQWRTTTVFVALGGVYFADLLGEPETHLALEMGFRFR